MKNKRKIPNKVKYNFGYDFLKVTGIIPAMLWVRPKIIRMGNNSKKIKGGVLIASNHVTFVDPIILHCAFTKRRLYSIATKDIIKNKIRKFLFSCGNCIIIDKENFSMASLHKIVDVLKQEKAVVIFPESTVNKGDGVKTYKSGFVLMALLSKKPILPVCIIKRDSWFKRTKIAIGEPIDVCSMCSPIPTMEEMDNVAKMLQEKEEEILLKYRDKQKEKKVKGK